MDLNDRSDEAKVAMRRALRLVTARFHSTDDPPIYNQTITEVLTEVSGDPEAGAYLCHALATLCMAGFATLATQNNAPDIEDALRAVALGWEDGRINL